MLDLKFVVDNRDSVLGALAARGQGLATIQAFPGLEGVDPWVLDGERRALIQETQQLRHRQRTVGEEIARRGKAKEDASESKAEIKGVADRIKQGEARLEHVKGAIERFLMVVPNLPDASVPVGKDATANREIRRVGEPRRSTSSRAGTPSSAASSGSSTSNVRHGLSGRALPCTGERARGSSAPSSSSCSSCRPAAATRR